MKKVLKLVVVLTSFAMAACSSLQSKPPEERVSERSMGRFDALMSGDYRKALSYTSPGYQERTSLSLYRANFAGASSWVNAEVLSVKCGDDDCSVKVLLEHKLGKSAGVGQTIFEERWIQIDGEWYLYPK